MKNFLVKAPSPFRTLNFLDKSFDFNGDAEAILPEEVTKVLPQGYSVIREIEEEVVEAIIPTPVPETPTPTPEVPVDATVPTTSVEAVVETPTKTKTKTK